MATDRKSQGHIARHCPGSPFLPVTPEEARARGWDQLDVVIVSGDAYVDHPSFGPAVIGRVLEAEGLRVGIIPQPDWRTKDAFTVFGRPRLFFGVTAGNLDSMVSNYTPARRRRRDDAYSPGGAAGRRPDRATIVYANRIREAYGGVPVVIGGIEASLRRFAHYDYWDDAVRRSILLDSRADVLVYGMGERQVREIAERLRRGGTVSDLWGIPGTAVVVREEEVAEAAGEDEIVFVEPFEEVAASKLAFARAFRTEYENQDPVNGKTVVQPHGNRFVVAARPAMPLSTEELDHVYSLPFTRRWHPIYDPEGVPALSEVVFSITSHRGCYGSCNFCALSAHQGRIVQGRSRESILEEARSFTRDPRFKGIIHDVGGPTANFAEPACGLQEKRGACRGRRCIAPEPCRHLRVDHRSYLETLRAVRSLPGVKKVFVRSGVRFDYAMMDRSREFLDELVAHHVSGQLKVAPEHVSDRVLTLMGKPPHRVYEDFVKEYFRLSEKHGKKQYLVPYFISGHPGSTLKDAVQLAEYVRDMGYFPEQVQDFTPTPMTVSTCMYWTGIDPFTEKPVHVPKGEEKQLQRALLQFKDPKNHGKVRKALELAGRKDLIGYGPKCLVPPDGKTAGQGSGGAVGHCKDRVARRMGRQVRRRG